MTLKAISELVEGMHLGFTVYHSLQNFMAHWSHLAKPGNILDVNTGKCYWYSDINLWHCYTLCKSKGLPIWQRIKYVKYK